jgi:hypothetical protein
VNSLGLNRLSRGERIALRVLLDGSVDRMTRAAVEMLSDYRERRWLRDYGEMLAETTELAEELRGWRP